MAKESIEVRVLRQMKENYDVQKGSEAQILFNDMLSLIKQTNASIFNAVVAIDLLKDYLMKEFLEKYLIEPKVEEVKKEEVKKE